MNRVSSPVLWGRLLSFIIPAVAVIGLIFLLISIQAGTESAAANLVNLLPIGFAFAAGMVASINPCGFLLLPSYISYHLGAEEEGFYELSTIKRLFKALLLGAVATWRIHCSGGSGRGSHCRRGPVADPGLSLRRVSHRRGDGWTGHLASGYPCLSGDFSCQPGPHQPPA